MELLLTLGHNSSAIAVRDGKVIAGYEEERHERLKSCSIFPLTSAMKCIALAQPKKSEKNFIFVSHWFDGFDLANNKNTKVQEKYWNNEYIDSLIREYNFKIISLSPEFTHHDAHAYSVAGFYEFHTDSQRDALIMVADGFGNRQEVMSLYSLTYDEIGMRHIDLFHRSYGYENSLGLFYQYATSYTGMTENQDEYKFLGYESHIHEVLDDENYNKLQTEAAILTESFIVKLENSQQQVDYDSDYIKLDVLDNVKNNHWSKFDEIINKLSFNNDDNKFALRTIIGNLIQTVLENVSTYFVEKYSPGVLLVNGGIFYNVKLNNRLERISEKFCVTPLAGDQGGALGFYTKLIGKFDYSNLFWGKRNIKEEVDKLDLDHLPDNVEIYHEKEMLVDRVVELLKDNEIPQVVLGDMEFGPRALCHTTTYSIPYHENVELINSYNKRNTVMPMAPVMLRKNLEYFFNEKQFNKTVGSDGFMILTYDYTLNHCPLYSGVMHKYPNEDLYSGRPQVVDMNDSTISMILDKMENTSKTLINTSYNVHGKPIVYTIQHALDDFQYQLERAKELNVKRPYLIIGTYEE